MAGKKQEMVEAVVSAWEWLSDAPESSDQKERADRLKAAAVKQWPETASRFED